VKDNSTPDIVISLFYSEQWEANQLDRKATTLECLASLVSGTSQLAAATNQFTTRKEENYSAIIFFFFYQVFSLSRMNTLISL